MLRFREVVVGAGDAPACRRCASSGVAGSAGSSPGPGAPVVEFDAVDGGGVLFTGTASLGPDDLVALARRATAAGAVRIGVRTSAEQLVDQAQMRRVLGSGIRILEVIFLGPTSAQHDTLSGAPGSFAAAEAVVRSCSQTAEELGVRVAVRGRVRVCAHNLQDSPATVMHLAELGATSVVLECDPHLDVRRSAEWVAAACDTGTVNRIWVAVTGIPAEALGDKSLHTVDVIDLGEERA